MANADTPEKRFSIMNLYSLEDTLSVADGSDLNTVDERQHFLGLYSGISSTVVVGAVKNLMTMGMG